MNKSHCRLSTDSKSALQMLVAPWLKDSDGISGVWLGLNPVNGFCYQRFVGVRSQNMKHSHQGKDFFLFCCGNKYLVFLRNCQWLLFPGLTSDCLASIHQQVFARHKALV